MPDITVSPPAIGLEAYFVFKDPVLAFMKNKLNTAEATLRLKVIGINNLKSMIEAELRDPYIDAYNPMGISNYDYKKDVLNGVPLYLFEHTSLAGKVTYLKSPLTYIADYSLTSDIIYANKLLMLDLGKLPDLFNTTTVFNDLSDLVFDRLGVRPDIREVSVGAPETITREDHDIRESVRINSISVVKSNATLLAETRHKYQQLTERLSDLGISLG